MRILVLGGTQFVGRHIVGAFLAAGHAVTILTRGQSPDPLPAAVERLRGDRDLGPAGLTALADRTWDACIDVSGYTPLEVRASAELLRERIDRYVFISAVSVYGDPDIRPVHETQPLLPPAAENITEINGETYGPLKVTCEGIVAEIYGERATLLRPQIVAGPYDLSGRYPYWIARAALGGETLAPGDGSDHVQIIDTRDIARFTVRVVENSLSGPFNLAGPRLTWKEFIDLIGVTNPIWINAEILRSANLNFLQLPLYRPEHGPRASLMDISNAHSLAAGLTLTAPAITAQDVRAWIQTLPDPNTLTLDAIPPEQEANLIRLAKQDQ